MNRKIEIYMMNDATKVYSYQCSTFASKTCKEAVARFKKQYPDYCMRKIKANFAK